MPVYGYVVVEGPHDVEVVGRLLKPFGLKRVQLLQKLDPFWRPLVPTKFPHKDDLLARVPVPVFFQGPTHSIAVHGAGGDKRLVPTVQETREFLDMSAAALTGIGILLDADSQESPADRFARKASELASLALPAPPAPGVLTDTSPRYGIFVIPDNIGAGTVDDLLLDCASGAYPSLLAAARTLVGGIDPDAPAFSGSDMDDFKKPAGRRKATVGAIASILRPGKAVQTSIQDNRWLEGATLARTSLVPLRRFLHDLLNLS